MCSSKINGEGGLRGQPANPGSPGKMAIKTECVCVIMTTRSLREFTQFIWWMKSSAKRPPTLRPSHLTWAASPPVGCYRLQPPSAFIIITQPESWYSFTIPRRVEGWVDLGTAGKVRTARAQGCGWGEVVRNSTLMKQWSKESIKSKHTL